MVRGRKKTFVYERLLGKCTSPLHLFVISKSSCLFSKFFSSDVSVQVNKGRRMIVTLPEHGQSESESYGNLQLSEDLIFQISSEILSYVANRLDIHVI